MDTPVPLVVEARPWRLRRVCLILAVLVVAGAVAVGALLKQSAAGTTFHTSDQIAVVVLGLLIAAGVLALARPAVHADAERIRIRNIVQSHDLRWQVVQAVRFDESASWATLDLHDDETVAILAIQAVDKDRAVEAVEGLRDLLEASRSPRIGD